MHIKFLKLLPILLSSISIASQQSNVLNLHSTLSVKPLTDGQQIKWLNFNYNNDSKKSIVCIEDIYTIDDGKEFNLDSVLSANILCLFIQLIHNLPIKDLPDDSAYTIDFNNLSHFEIGEAGKSGEDFRTHTSKHAIYDNSASIILREGSTTKLNLFEYNKQIQQADFFEDFTKYCINTVDNNIRINKPELASLWALYESLQYASNIELKFSKDFRNAGTRRYEITWDDPFIKQEQKYDTRGLSFKSVFEIVHQNENELPFLRLVTFYPQYRTITDNELSTQTKKFLFRRLDLLINVMDRDQLKELSSKFNIFEKVERIIKGDVALCELVFQDDCFHILLQLINEHSIFSPSFEFQKSYINSIKNTEKRNHVQNCLNLLNNIEKHDSEISYLVKQLIAANHIYDSIIEVESQLKQGQMISRDSMSMLPIFSEFISKELGNSRKRVNFLQDNTAILEFKDSKFTYQRLTEKTAKDEKEANKLCTMHFKNSIDYLYKYVSPKEAPNETTKVSQKKPSHNKKVGKQKTGPKGKKSKGKK